MTITVATQEELAKIVEECGYEAAEPARDQDTTGLLSLLVQANGHACLLFPDDLKSVEWGLYTEAEIEGPITGVLLTLAPTSGPPNAQLSTRFIELRDVFADYDDDMTLLEWLALTLDNIAVELNELLPYYIKAFGEEA